MGRSGRLFEVIQVLRSARAPMPARAIAAALEVHKRTIYRDIGTLQAMRVPIEGEAGVGYVMRPGFDLPPLMFTAEEVEAITVGLSLLGRTGDGGLQAAALRVRQKLAEVLPKQERTPDDVSLHVSRWHEIPAASVDCGLIREAIRHERKLRLEYRTAEECLTSRIVWPLALTYWIDSIVLAAWCELRDGYRHFRVDRMSACAPTGGLFTGQGQRLRAGLSAPQ